jgi:hypothetical protein
MRWHSQARKRAGKLAADWHASGWALWFYPTIGTAIAVGFPWLTFTFSRPAGKSAGSIYAHSIGTPAHISSMIPVIVVPTLLAESAVCKAGDANAERR